MARTAIVGGRRRAVAATARAQARPYTFPAPVRGWVTNQSLAVGMKGAALVLDNFFPTQTGIRARGGSAAHVVLPETAPVLSLFTYVAGGLSKMFASTADALYDVSNGGPFGPYIEWVDGVAMEWVDGVLVAWTGSTAPAVSGMPGGYFSTVQFETSGGSFLYAVNGEDNALLLDGADWESITDSSSPIAISGVDTSLFSHVWVWKNRLFFVENGSMRAWYLEVDSLGGAASEVTMAGVFQNGGSLLCGGTWSIDAGDGADDKCVFVSDRGEVAIYEGSDPSDPDAWGLIGRYEMGGRPLGKNATMRGGGDLLICTTEGVVPLSQVLDKDPAALSLAAISRAIEPDWTREANARIGLPWEMEKWPERNMALVTNPVVDATTPAQCFVVNMETGAWTRYTGWDARCFAVHNGLLYFGTSDGNIVQGEASGSDRGALYTCRYAGHFDALRNPAASKTVALLRATFRASRPFVAQLSASVNYAQSFPSPPSSPVSTVTDVWDTGLWDQALWDAQSSEVVSTRWHPVASFGFSFSPQLQMSFGVTTAPAAELVSIDAMVEIGGIVV